VYGLLHRHLAAEVLERCNDETINEEAKKVAHLLCMASGIFEYIKNALLPSFGTRFV